MQVEKHITRTQKERAEYLGTEGQQGMPLMDIQGFGINFDLAKRIPVNVTLLLG